MTPVARKIIDTYPVISLTIGGEAPQFTSYRMSDAEAYAARDEILEIIRTSLRRQTRRQMDVDCKIVSEAVCEHCGWRWTETSPDYNGGCCEVDEASAPTKSEAA